MWETLFQALGQEDPLEKGMTTHSSILAWRFPWTEEPGGLQTWDHKVSDKTFIFEHMSIKPNIFIKCLIGSLGINMNLSGIL